MEKIAKDIIICITFLCLLCSSSVVLAQQVYKQVDKSGRVTYVTKAPFQGAKPAELPELTKSKEYPAAELLKTCDNHGGINCQAGPDEDGSVICFDDFRDASARYNFSCSTTKLRIADIKTNTKAGQLKVIVRNTRSVQAEYPTVKVKQDNKKEFSLSGPELIEAFGVGEFVLDELKIEQPLNNVKTSDVLISCRNCD